MLSYLHLRIDAAQKEIPFVLDKTVYKKLITRAILLNLTNLLWQTVYLIPIVIVCSVPLIGWFTPIFTIVMECYFLGYSMLDYGLATEKKIKLLLLTMYRIIRGFLLEMVFYFICCTYCLLLAGWLRPFML